MFKAFKIRFFSLFALLILAMAFNGQAIANDWWVDVRNDRVNKIIESIDQGQDPNITNDEGHTALIYAYREDALKSFDALIEHPKVDIDRQNNYLESPIMYPALANDFERVKVLVDKGAQLNNLGWSPLHYAAIKGNTQIIEYLLDHGAWANVPAPDGSTPLMMSVSIGNADAVRALMEAGANPAMLNAEGISALDIAEEKKNRMILQLLAE